VRFETNPDANDRFGRAALAAALFAVGARRVRLRYAYGMANLPQVVTFAANSMEHADNLALAAYAELAKDGGPAHPRLIVRQYKRNIK
jgi:hypothetical protein